MPEVLHPLRMAVNIVSRKKLRETIDKFQDRDYAVLIQFRRGPSGTLERQVYSYPFDVDIDMMICLLEETTRLMKNASKLDYKCREEIE